MCFFAINCSEMGYKMLRTIFLTVVSILLYSYSVMRYLDVWKRGKIPSVFYGLIHVISLMVSAAILLQWAGRISEYFIIAGSAYTALYSAIMLVTPVFCFLRGIVRFFGKRRQWNGKWYRFINHPTKLILCFLLVTAVLGAYGFINERHVRRTTYDFTLDRKMVEDTMSVVILSDLRVGSRMTLNELSELIQKVNEAEPDLVLFCGNTIGSRVTEATVRKTVDQLDSLSAKQGIYLTEGPEDAGQLEQFGEDFEKRGLHLLRDDCLFLSNGVQLAGCRESKSEKRKSLSDTLSLLNPDQPSIVVAYNIREEDILLKKKVGLVATSRAGGSFGWTKKGTTNFVRTAGLRSPVLSGKYVVPSEFVIVNLR